METGLLSPLGDLDLSLIKQLEIDGRQTVSELAMKIVASRPTVRKRLDSLLRQKVIRITAMYGPAGISSRNTATIGLNVRPHCVRAVAERLSVFRNVYTVSICAGRYDIMAWAVFGTPSRLSDFVMRYLNKDSDIMRTEVMVPLHMKKVSLAYLADEDGHLGDSIKDGTTDNGRVDLDPIDLKLIEELHIDGRQAITVLARKVGVSRDTVRKKLDRLLEQRIVRVFAAADPAALGYQAMAVFGINSQPTDVERVAERLASYRSIRFITICTGRYDIIAWALCRDPRSLSHLIVDEIGSDPSIVRTETMINLDLKKFAYDSGVKYGEVTPVAVESGGI